MRLRVETRYVCYIGDNVFVRKCNSPRIYYMKEQEKKLNA